MRWALAAAVVWAGWTYWRDLPEIREVGGSWVYYRAEFAENLRDFTEAGGRISGAIQSKFESLGFRADQSGGPDPPRRKGPFESLD